MPVIVRDNAQVSLVGAVSLVSVPSRVGRGRPVTSTES